MNPNEPAWFIFIFLKVAPILFSNKEIKKEEKEKIPFNSPPIGSEIKENIFYQFMNHKSYFINGFLVKQIPLLDSNGKNSGFLRVNTEWSFQKSHLCKLAIKLSL